jgi:hypothetical protein
MSHKKDAVKGALTTSAGAVATAIAGGNPIGTIVAGVVAVAWTGANSVVSRSANKRFDRFNAALESALNEQDDGQAAQLVIDLDGDANVRDLMLATFRSILDAVCEEALGAVARLMADYVGGQKPLDSFFKRTASLLVDVTAEELVTLKTVIDATQQWQQGEVTFITAARERGLRVGIHGEPESQTTYNGVENAHELVRLLLKHGFASERTGKDATETMGKSPGVSSANLRAGDVMRLGRYVK